MSAMRYGKVAGIELPVSRLVQGAMGVSTKEQDKTNQLLDDLFAMGCNAMDNAVIYGGGDCEKALGVWVKSRGIRDKFVVITKGGHPDHEGHRITPEKITQDVEKSLGHLQMDHIDLYMLHRDNPAVPVGTVVEVLTTLQREGKIRAFCGSNWNYTRIKEGNEYAEKNGLIPFAASSPNFSLAEQFKEPWGDCRSISGDKGKADREWYAKTQIPLFFWSSLAGGFFSGRFTRDNLAQMKGYQEELCVKSYCYEPNFQRLDRAKELAAKKCVSIAQIAMAYVIHSGLNAFCLTGARSKEEFADTMKAVEIELSPAEQEWLDLRPEKS